MSKCVCCVECWSLGVSCSSSQSKLAGLLSYFLLVKATCCSPQLCCVNFLLQKNQLLHISTLLLHTGTFGACCLKQHLNISTMLHHDCNPAHFGTSSWSCFACSASCLQVCKKALTSSMHCEMLCPAPIIALQVHSSCSMPLDIGNPLAV